MQFHQFYCHLRRRVCFFVKWFGLYQLCRLAQFWWDQYRLLLVPSRWRLCLVRRYRSPLHQWPLTLQSECSFKYVVSHFLSSVETLAHLQFVALCRFNGILSLVLVQFAAAILVRPSFLLRCDSRFYHLRFHSLTGGNDPILQEAISQAEGHTSAVRQAQDL